MIKTLSQSGKTAYGLFTIAADTEEDREGLDVTKLSMGDKCYVIETQKWYILNSEGEWFPFVDEGDGGFDDGMKIVTIEETNPTIAPEDNTIYQCGELESLTIADPPATGEYIIKFSSGATPTATTFPASIEGLEDFAAQANTEYRIEVKNNVAKAYSDAPQLLYTPRTGCFYPKILNISLTDPVRTALTGRYQYCDELKEATVAGSQTIGGGGYRDTGGSVFSSCGNLEKIALVDGYSPTASQTYVAGDCPKLREVIIGSIGHPVTGTLYENAFRGSGGQSGGATMTIYVADDRELPLANAPYGLQNATVIYRSATTGEILEV